MHCQLKTVYSTHCYNNEEKLDTHLLYTYIIKKKKLDNQFHLAHATLIIKFRSPEVTIPYPIGFNTRI